MLTNTVQYGNKVYIKVFGNSPVETSISKFHLWSNRVPTTSNDTTCAYDILRETYCASLIREIEKNKFILSNVAYDADTLIPVEGEYLWPYSKVVQIKGTIDSGITNPGENWLVGGKKPSILAWRLIFDYGENPELYAICYTTGDEIQFYCENSLVAGINEFFTLVQQVDFVVTNSDYVQKIKILESYLARLHKQTIPEGVFKGPLFTDVQSLLSVIRPGLNWIYTESVQEYLNSQMQNLNFARSWADDFVKRVSMIHDRTKIDGDSKVILSMIMRICRFHLSIIAVDASSSGLDMGSFLRRGTIANYLRKVYDRKLENVEQFRINDVGDKKTTIDWSGRNQSLFFGGNVARRDHVTLYIYDVVDWCMKFFRDEFSNVLHKYVVSESPILNDKLSKSSNIFGIFNSAVITRDSIDGIRPYFRASSFVVSKTGIVLYNDKGQGYGYGLLGRISKQTECFRPTLNVAMSNGALHSFELDREKTAYNLLIGPSNWLFYQNICGPNIETAVIKKFISVPVTFWKTKAGKFVSSYDEQCALRYVGTGLSITVPD